MKSFGSIVSVILILLLTVFVLAGCDSKPGVTSAAGSSAAVSSVPASSDAISSDPAESVDGSSGGSGTAVFSEDFEAGMDKWTTAEGNWAISDDESKVLRQSDRDAWEAIATAGDLGWTDYSVSADVKIHNGYAGILGRVDENGNMYLFDVNELGFCVWRKYQEGWSQLTSDNEYPVTIDEWHTLKMTFEGSTITVFIDGVQVGEPVNDNLIGSGKIGVRSSYGTFTLDNVIVE